MVKHFLGIGVVAVFAALGACGDSDDAGTCETLKSCCSSLTDSKDQSECQAVVDGADDTTCGEAQSDFVNDSLCVVTVSGGSSESTSSGGGSGCSGLSSCCESVPSEEQSACNEIAAEGNDSVCTDELDALQTAGSCGKSSGSSGGGSTSSGGSGGTGCSGLSSCCGSVPSEDQAACKEVASEGNDSVCSEELSAFQESSYCGGSSGSSGSTGSSGSSGGSGCSGLSSCCGSVPSADEPSCDAVVSAGSDTDCSAELSAYQSAGYCK